MADSVGDGGGAMGTPTAGSAPFEPFFKAWSEWLANNMGGMTAVPGASLPWLTKPGTSTGEEIKPLPQGALANDPLLSALDKVMSAANPLSNIVPLDWMEITRALQTIWMREMSNPQRAMQVATEYNQRLFQTTMNVWTDAVSRFWGLPQQEEEEEGKPDPRFSSEAWEANPYYRMLKETYFLATEYLLNEADETDGQGDTEEQTRLKFHLRQFVEAMAPVNFLLTNPDVLKRAFETGGTSLVEGARNLISDIEDGSLSMVDAAAFEVGENLATTPGKVVYRNELMELIQYEPQTEQVYETPILFMPPWINKYYIVDLRPENSFMKYLVEQGYQVFLISWKSADESMASIKFEDYMKLGPLAAADVARQITGADKVNPVGYCIGGTLLGTTLAYLAADESDERREAFGSPTFLTAMMDFSDIGDQAVFVDEPRVEFMEMTMKELGYLPGQQLSNMFNLLQPTQLIWSNVVTNYLMGQKPPAFDMLYWNSDSTSLPRDAHQWYLRNTYVENNLKEPGKIEFDGRRIDLTKITGDIYSIGTRKDHIAPWKSGWAICRLTSGNIRYALAGGGHIAGVVSPPEKSRGYWVSDGCGQYETADEWLENAEEHQGTWWDDWTAWLASRSGEQVDPPGVGSEQYSPIEDAPGSYVKRN
ncbi:MAG TPA: class I poly(R)-hydroxyalkanoic acid synthase [Rubrobacteraceae bacterium]|nr:class I poly(R)-hydroxyalkanoic acid synthase [Rubrobacteraceae bacterium]